MFSRCNSLNYLNFNLTSGSLGYSTHFILTCVKAWCLSWAQLVWPTGSRSARACSAPCVPLKCAHRLAPAKHSMWSLLGPDGDKNEMICQIACHERSLLALGLSQSQAHSWWKQLKDADFISIWARPKKPVFILFQANFVTTFNLWPERTRVFSQVPSECWLFTGLYRHTLACILPSIALQYSN